MLCEATNTTTYESYLLGGGTGRSAFFFFDLYVAQQKLLSSLQIFIRRELVCFLNYVRTRNYREMPTDSEANTIPCIVNRDTPRIQKKSLPLNLFHTDLLLITTIESGYGDLSETSGYAILLCRRRYSSFSSTAGDNKPSSSNYLCFTPESLVPTFFTDLED